MICFSSHLNDTITVLQFIKSLNLRSVIVLSASCIDDSMLKFLEENNIRVNYIENSVNDSLRGLFPIAEEMVTESLKLLSDNSNYPLMVICKTGKILVGVVMACLRKMQHWALISIFEEYRRFAGGSRLQQQHEQFIELFDTDLVPVNESAPEFLLRC
jgi:tyrosine-protein phosphatase OCA1